MLYFTGILTGDVGSYAKRSEPVGEKLMSFIDHFRDFSACIREIDITGIGDSDLIFFPKVFHSHTDTGFFKIQFDSHIYGANDRKPFTQYQYRLQIIFCGFIVTHSCPPGYTPLCNARYFCMYYSILLKKFP
jgi:hypothetical protein